MKDDRAMDTLHLMETPVQEIGLGTRATNILLRAGCKCFGDVLKIELEKIHSVRGCGYVALSEICAKLKEYGFVKARGDAYIEMVMHFPDKTKYDARKSLLRKPRVNTHEHI